MTTRRRAFGGAAAAFTLVVLSACGGGGADGDDVASAGGEANPADAESTEDTEPLDADAQALALVECMRDQGVDLPDPQPGEGGLSEALHDAEENYDRETYDEALTACEELLPQRAHDDGHDPERDEDMLDLAECLREQGLDVPDNVFEGGGMHDIDEDELRAAMEECRDVAAGGEHG